MTVIDMVCTIVRLCLVPAMAAGIIGGAAVGMAGMANATTGPAAPTTTTTAPGPTGPGYQY